MVDFSERSLPQLVCRSRVEINRDRDCNFFAYYSDKMSRRIRSNRGDFSRPDETTSDGHGDVSDSALDDLDIDFSLTESGRTVAHLVSTLKTDEDDALGEVSQTVLPTKPAQQRSAAKAIPKPNVPSSSGMAMASQPSSQGSSGSGFISGIMNPGGGSGLLSHTPPTNLGTSYEVQHFGKRPRAGSISGRLRSASDLEDKGLIDRQQKAILKDLIISGDEDMQAALDQYEQGNTVALENMIRSGELTNRAAADIDLLGDLDLDFLTVEDHFHAEAAMHPAMQPVSAPIPMQPPPTFPTREQVQQMTTLHPNMVSPPAYESDGIGELEFNGELLLPTSTSQSYGSKQGSIGSNEVDQRFRSNSLAFGALLNESAGSADSDVLYGRWMDRDFPRAGDGAQDQGGIGASLVQYGQFKTDSKLKPTKAQLAEEKRRIKQEKREQKQREKAEKKERRETQMREKKEKEAREKYERKEKKNALKANTENLEENEPRETPSGLGRPRSMSDPNLSSTIGANGLLQVERPEGWVGAYSPESRKMRIERFLAKRDHRVWTKKVKYDVRKNFADSRLRVKGRFVKKEDELLMRDLISLT